MQECERTGRLKELFAFVFELDGVPLNGRSVRLEGFENVLYALSRSGAYYDFGRRQFVDYETDKKSLPGWGTLRNGKEYPITVASVDICQNSELVKKYKPAVMENSIVHVDRQNRIVEPLPAVPQWERIEQSVASKGDLRHPNPDY